MCYVVDIEMSSSTSIQSSGLGPYLSPTFMSNNDSLSSTPSSTNAPSPSEPSTTTPNVASTTTSSGPSTTTTSGPSSSGNYGQIKSVYVISISTLLLQLQVATTQCLVLHF